MSSGISALATELVWSLWTELGVPGVIRNHADFALDPEPLILATPELAGEDARIVEEALRWCKAHNHRVSMGRVKALFAGRSVATRARFSDFAFSLEALGGPRWPRDAASAALVGKISEKQPSILPVDRPALLRFRLRGLAGLGARADVLADLLGRRNQWTGPGDLPEAGYTRRAISEVLADLADAGLVSALSEGRAIRYRLREPDALGQLVGPIPPHSPWWSAIFLLVELGLDLEGLRERPAHIRRVLAHLLAKGVLEQLARALELDDFPRIQGNPDYYDALLAWIQPHVAAIVAGTSPALTVVPVGRFLTLHRPDLLRS